MIRPEGLILSENVFTDNLTLYEGGGSPSFVQQ